VGMPEHMAPSIAAAIRQQKWKISPNPLASIRTVAHRAFNTAPMARPSRRCSPVPDTVLCGGLGGECTSTSKRKEKLRRLRRLRRYICLSAFTGDGNGF
jgi:hypothetical protein